MYRLAAATLLLACAVPAAADPSGLTHSELSSELVGKTIVWWEEQGWRHGYLMLMPGGGAEMTVERPRPEHDLGRWSIRGDEMCTSWAEARDGAEKCYRVSRGEDGLFVTTGGNVFEVRELGV